MESKSRAYSGPRLRGACIPASRTTIRRSASLRRIASSAAFVTFGSRPRKLCRECIFGWQAKAGRQRIPENDDTNRLVRRARGRNGHKHTKQREQQPVCKALDLDGVPPI